MSRWDVEVREGKVDAPASSEKKEVGAVQERAVEAAPRPIRFESVGTHDDDLIA